MKKAVIIIPTYNEKGNVETLIRGIFDQQKLIKNWEINIIIIDSHSPDGTGKVIKNLQKKYTRLFLLETAKEGLGKALMNGFVWADKNIKPYLAIQMDADLSHSPDHLPAFFKKIEEGADFVVGTRYAQGGSIPPNWGLHRKIFSILGNLIVRFGFMKLKVSDWTSGYRAIKFWLVKNALKHIKNYSGYVFQIAFLDFALKNNAVVDEVPIQFKERKSGISKISFFQYIFNILFYIFNNSAFIKYVIVGFTGFFIDFGISYIAIEKIHWPVWRATILSGETAIICNFLLNNYWSFAHKRIKGSIGSFLWSFLKFNLITSGSVIIQIILLQLLVMLLGKQFWYIYKVFIIGFVIIPYSYILYNKVIWKSK